MENMFYSWTGRCSAGLKGIVLPRSSGTWLSHFKDACSWIQRYNIDIYFQSHPDLVL